MQHVDSRPEACQRARDYQLRRRPPVLCGQTQGGLLWLIAIVFCNFSVSHPGRSSETKTAI